MRKLGRRRLETSIFCSFALLTAVAQARADDAVPPPPTADSSTSTPAQSTPASESSTTTAPTETVITIKNKQTPKTVPQSAASQTAISGSTIDKGNPAQTMSDVISEYVPGASANPDNGLRIRGADDQFSTYLDGVPLPQSVSGTITDVFDPKDIQTLRVYTGGFPAELGGQLAGVFDITTKIPQGSPQAEISQSVAGDSTYDSQGSVEGGSGSLGYFGSISRRSSNFFLNPPTETADHDSGHEDHGFLKFDYAAGASDNMILQLGDNGSNFEVPGTEDDQHETGDMANIVWSHIAGLATSRFSIYTHRSTLTYIGSPDDINQGILETNENLQASYVGVRGDQSLETHDSKHFFKAGFDVSKATTTQDFTVDIPPAGGSPASTLSDVSAPHAWNIGVYAQDDWTPGRFEANYGVRYDVNNQDLTTNQVSPRVNMKYRLNGHDTLHAYYDKLFQPVSVEDAAHLVGNDTIGDNGTDSPDKPERDDFYEAGIDHTQRRWTFGLLAYYKTGRDVRDDDEVGNANIFLPVDDAKAYFNGYEFTMSHEFSSALHGYGNFAASWNKNAGPVTGGLNEGPLPTTYFFDDHDQTYTSTAGLAYDRRGVYGDLDGEYGSGQPYGEIDNSDGVPLDVNYLRVPPHLIFNLDAGKRWSSGFKAGVFVNNMFNDAYIIKEITGLSDAQFAEGRVVGVNLSQEFGGR